MTIALKILAVALTVAGVPMISGAAVATPMSAPLAVQNAVSPSTETVQYRRGYRGRNYGGAGLGIVAGALIGGAILGATQPYGYRGYGRDYSYGPGYAYEPGYRQGYVAVGPGGDEVAYCAQRFRSYDPGSGTYLGFDGMRHPCP